MSNTNGTWPAARRVSHTMKVPSIMDAFDPMAEAALTTRTT